MLNKHGLLGKMVFHMIIISVWGLIIWQTTVRFEGVTRMAFIYQWNLSLIFLYAGIFGLYHVLKDKNERLNRYVLLLIKTIMFLVCLAFFGASFYNSKITFLDTFKENQIVREVQVQDRKTVYRGGTNIYLYGETKVYRTVDGKIKLQPNNRYQVRILKNTGIILGIRQLPNKWKERMQSNM